MFISSGKLIASRHKRSVLKVLVLIVGGIFLTSCDSQTALEEKTTYAKLFIFDDGFVSLHTGYAVATLSNFSSMDTDTGLYYRIKQTGVDKSGGVLAPSPVYIDDKPFMIEQCGTYDFVIGVNGDYQRIEGFRYSGERNVQVARGIGWSMFITRDDWKETK